MRGVADVARVLRLAADQLDRSRDRRPVFEVPVADTPIFERDETAAALRCEDAASVMDPDTLGYVIVRLQGTDDGGVMRLGCMVEDDHWPVFRHMLGQIIEQASAP